MFKDYGHYLVIPEPHLFEVIAVEQADAVTHHHRTASCVHTHCITVPFGKPVGQPCAPEFGKDEGTGLDYGMKAMLPALAQPAVEILFRA